MVSFSSGSALALTQLFEQEENGVIDERNDYAKLNLVRPHNLTDAAC